MNRYIKNLSYFKYRKNSIKIFIQPMNVFHVKRLSNCTTALQREIESRVASDNGNSATEWCILALSWLHVLSPTDG